jgi:hypothetical protein
MQRALDENAVIVAQMEPFFGNEDRGTQLDARLDPRGGED